MASKVAGYIGKIEKNGDWVAIGSTAYGVCDTAANVAEKAVDMKGFELITGATVYVKFTHGNTAQNPTVNINETGAKGIISADNSPVSAWLDGAVLALTFDGNNWATSSDLSGSAIDEAISTVSGSLISLTDAADAPVADLKVAIEPVQAGSGDPSPSNVRAISGWDVCKVYSTGKNLRGATNTSVTYSAGTLYWTVDSDGYASAVDPDNDSRAWIYANCQWFVHLKAGNYYAFVEVKYSGDTSTSFMVKKPDGTSLVNISIPTNITAPTIYKREFTITEDMAVGIISKMWYGLQFRFCISTEELSSYEPYNSTTYTISFGSAGTVYGGTLDVTSGVLTVDRKKITVGDLSWTKTTDENYGIYYRSLITGKYKGLSNFLCDSFIVRGRSFWDNLITAISGNSSTGQIYIRDNRQDYTDGNAFKVANQDVVIVYPLATPITVQLTPAEVRTLLGLNNIWADTGDVSLTYWKEAGVGIAEAVSNASANAKYDDGQTRGMITQSSETAMVATKDYTAGDLVIIGGQLLRATENIATTTELVIGEDGNVEVVDLETVLKELSARISALEEE